MIETAARLDRALRAAGFAITGVSIGDPAIKATWKVVPASLQAAAQPIIDAFDPTAQSILDAELTTTSTGTSRQKDMLATCALIVRARGIAAWNLLDTLGKKNATLAEADVWENIREFIEKNT